MNNKIKNISFDLGYKTIIKNADQFVEIAYVGQLSDEDFSLIDTLVPVGTPLVMRIERIPSPSSFAVIKHYWIETDIAIKFLIERFKVQYGVTLQILS